MSSIATNRSGPAASMSGNSVAAQIFALASNPLIAAAVNAPGKLAIEQKQFRIRAEGNAIVSVNTTTVKPTLYGFVGNVQPASPLTAGSWTILAAGAAVAISTVTLTSPWWLEANLIFDSTGGFLQGIWNQMVNNAWTAAAAIGNQLSGVNGTNQNQTQNAVVIAPSDPVIQFAIGLTFSAANAANFGNLANFELGF